MCCCQGPLCQCLLGQATLEFHPVNQTLKHGCPQLKRKHRKRRPVHRETEESKSCWTGWGQEPPRPSIPSPTVIKSWYQKQEWEQGKCLLWIPSTSLLPALPEVSLHFKLSHPSGTASNMSWPHFCTFPPQMIYLSHLFIYTHISFTAIHLSLLHFCLLSSNYKTD